MTRSRFFQKPMTLMTVLFVVVAAGLSAYVYRTFISNEDGRGSGTQSSSVGFGSKRGQPSPDDAPMNVDTWIERARSLSSAGKFAEAGQAFDHAVRLKPDLPAQIYADYAGVLTLGQPGRTVSPKTAQLIAKALDQDPTNKKALFLAGSAAMQTQSYDKAVEHWNKLLTMIPTGTAEYNMLNQAIAEARERSHVGTTSRSPARLNETVENLTAKASSHPSDAKGWADLGKALMDRGDYTRASDAYKKAAELTKMRSPQVLADYAASLAMRENQSISGEPATLLRRALELDPDNKKALFLAGMEATQRKDYKGGISLWSKLLAKLRPESTQYQLVERRIAQARQMLAEQTPSMQ